MRPGGTTPDRALRTTTSARRASSTTSKTTSLQRRVTGSGTWPPHGWSDDGGTPAAINAGGGALNDLIQAEVGGGVLDRTTVTPGAIEVAKGDGMGAHTMVFSVEADDGSKAIIQFNMRTTSDVLTIKNSAGQKIAEFRGSDSTLHLKNAVVVDL